MTCDRDCPEIYSPDLTRVEATLADSLWLLSASVSGRGFGFSASAAPGGPAEPGGMLVSTGQPVLDGLCEESLTLAGAVPVRHGQFRCFESGEFRMGYAQVAVQSVTLEEQAFVLYNSLLDSLCGRQLFRIWNFVPDINRVHAPLLENYKLFCSGRSRAFYGHAIAGGRPRMPAASATGCQGELLTVIFLAGDCPVEDWENPQQVPAYQYPQEYGPRPPSFSRATRVEAPGGEWIFVSGTAAIKGSKTLSAGDFSAQMAVMLENINLVLNRTGRDLEAPLPGERRHFRVYLRHSRNMPELLARLRGPVFGAGDTWIVVEADICRKDLEIEMEVMILPEA